MATLNKNAAGVLPLKIEILEWKPLVKNTMQGIATIGITPPGIKLIGCTYHRREADGKRWIGLPAKSYVQGGQKKWSVVVETMDSDAHWKLQNLMLKAMDRFLGDSQERPEADDSDSSSNEQLY